MYLSLLCDSGEEELVLVGPKTGLALRVEILPGGDDGRDGPGDVGCTIGLNSFFALVDP